MEGLLKSDPKMIPHYQPANNGGIVFMKPINFLENIVGLKSFKYEYSDQTNY